MDIGDERIPAESVSLVTVGDCTTEAGGDNCGDVGNVDKRDLGGVISGAGSVDGFLRLVVLAFLLVARLFE